MGARSQRAGHLPPRRDSLRPRRERGRAARRAARRRDLLGELRRRRARQFHKGVEKEARRKSGDAGAGGRRHGRHGLQVGARCGLPGSARTQGALRTLLRAALAALLRHTPRRKDGERPRPQTAQAALIFAHRGKRHRVHNGGAPRRAAPRRLGHASRDRHVRRDRRRGTDPRRGRRMVHPRLSRLPPGIRIQGLHGRKRRLSFVPDPNKFRFGHLHRLRTRGVQGGLLAERRDGELGSNDRDDRRERRARAARPRKERDGVRGVVSHPRLLGRSRKRDLRLGRSPRHGRLRALEDRSLHRPLRTRRRRDDRRKSHRSERGRGARPHGRGQIRPYLPRLVRRPRRRQQGHERGRRGGAQSRPLRPLAALERTFHHPIRARRRQFHLPQPRTSEQREHRAPRSRRAHGIRFQMLEHRARRQRHDLYLTHGTRGRSHPLRRLDAQSLHRDIRHGRRRVRRGRQSQQHNIRRERDARPRLQIRLPFRGLV